MKANAYSAVLNMIFSMLAALTVASCLGLFGPNGALFFGILALTTVPSYIVSAKGITEAGDGFSGGIFGIFACFFAVTAGTFNILTPRKTYAEETRKGYENADEG